MPNAPKTPHRSIRVDDDTWQRLGDHALPYGGRATVLRRLVHLFLTDRTVRRRVAAYADDLARDSTTVAAARSADH